MEGGETRVVKLQRKGGVIVQDCQVYIGREVKKGGWDLERSKWGNPFGPWNTPEGTEVVLEKYRDYVLSKPELLKALPELKGKVLGCWCHPNPCHGDVLVKLVEELQPKRKREELEAAKEKLFADYEGEEDEVGSEERPSKKLEVEKKKEGIVEPIPGLELYTEFVSESEERTLLGAIDEEEWDTTLKRRIQYYGYKYDYMNRSVSKNQYLGPLPEWSGPVVQRMIEKKLVSKSPEQIIVNEYNPGQGISAHTDSSAFGEPVISLSLGSDCVMVFTRGHEKREILLKKRCLLIMRDEARWSWKHEIPRRRRDTIEDAYFDRYRRTSLTFRYMKNETH